MLTLLADQPECLWDDSLPVEVKAAARGSGGVGCAAVRSRVVMADRGALAARVPGDGAAGVDRGAADDRDGDLHPLDGAQAALPVGVQDVGGGGVGLDSSAAVLSDLAERAGAGRVDGAQADPADWSGDGVGVDACVDREGDAGEAVPAAGGADRFDGDRGGCEVTRPMRGWRRPGSGCSAGRAASSPSSSRRRRRGCGIARGRWAASCGRSRARSAGAPARPRQRC